MGASAGAGPAGRVAQENPAGSNANFTAGVGRENHRRCASGAVPTSDAQSHLAGRAERSLDPQAFGGCASTLRLELSAGPRKYFLARGPSNVWLAGTGATSTGLGEQGLWQKFLKEVWEWCV